MGNLKCRVIARGSLYHNSCFEIVAVQPGFVKLILPDYKVPQWVSLTKVKILECPDYLK